MGRPTPGSVLKSIRYATVSTVDEEGRPWAAPVWYVYDDDLNIYWWSPVKSRNSVNIEHDGSVYITIFDSTLPEGDGFGLYIRAEASEVPAESLAEAMELFNASTIVFKIEKDDCSGDAPTRFYKATPSSIWMNDDSTENGKFIDIRTSIEVKDLAGDIA